MKLYLFTFILFSQLLIANEKNERDDIKRSLVEYLQSIDQKNASRISKHFYFDRRGWNRGPVFCFGEGTTREFNDLNELKSFFDKWSNTQSKTYSTHIEELQIFQALHYILEKNIIKKAKTILSISAGLRINPESATPNA